MFPSGSVTQRFLKPCKPEQWVWCCQQKSNKSATLWHTYMQCLFKESCIEGFNNHRHIFMFLLKLSPLLIHSVHSELKSIIKCEFGEILECMLLKVCTTLYYVLHTMYYVLCTTIFYCGCLGPGTYPSCFWAIGDVRPGQVVSPLPG